MAGKHFCREGAGGSWWTSKLNLWQQSALTAANSLLGCVWQNIARSSRKVIFPLYATPVKTQLERCVRCWALQGKRDMDLLGWCCFKEAGVGLDNLQSSFPTLTILQSCHSVMLFPIKAAFRVAPDGKKKQPWMCKILLGEAPSIFL